MKKNLPKFLAILISGFVATTPIIISCQAFAESSNCVITSVLGDSKCKKNSDGIIYKVAEDASGKDVYNCSCDDGKGSSTIHLLDLVVDILSAVVGVLAVIGITITGIQYLTSAGNEEKARKAKRRLVEIIIGVVIYVLLYSIKVWLLPANS